MAPPRLTYDHLPNAYPEEPTPQQLEHLVERRRIAEASPLERGDLLQWKGPSLHPEALPPASYPPTNSSAVNPHRPLLRALLSSTGPAHSSTPWSLELVEALQTKIDTDNRSQGWRCRATRGSGGGGEAVDVVVKLLHESLYWYPSRLIAWKSAKVWEEKEASNYARLTDWQGADIPINYGFYHFDLPCGERIVGMVLEDLSVIARTLWTFADQERKRKGGDLQLSDGVDNLFTPALQAVRRFQDRDILSARPQPDDIMILKNYKLSEGPLPLIFLDLAQGETRAEVEEEAHAEGEDMPQLALSDGQPHQPWHWRSYDEEYMHQLIESQVGWQAWTDWCEMEDERGLLGLVENTWWK